MCGRFAVDSEVNDLIEEFVAVGGNIQDWRPGYNIRPTDPVPVIIESQKTGELVRRLELARWSLVPGWSKELKLKVPTFNARAETAAEKSMFKASVASKRALIPATGYYEWHTEGKTKTPYFIRPTEGQMAFAGLYSWWKDASLAPDDPNRWVLTATILTMDAVPHLAPIHDRNPVPLAPEFWSDWLNPEIVGDQAFVEAAVAASVPVAESLEYYEVGPVTGDGPELTLPLAPVSNGTTPS
jgi:putative SOS response-associated peptidase YedK